jgi:peptidoglycan/LPS O-acetylase OafA/YrhL
MRDRPHPGPAAGAESAHPALAYRPEIDGLRAFAILPILLLHCGVSQLQGGFVGVDIFFVISGYLITAIITREIEAGSFTLADFYRRRIVRILPALLAMAAIVLAVGCWLLFPNQLQDLGRSAASVGAFASNIYFYATTDYFAQSAELKPLVHTWSLAVEEQFYLLYPLFLLAMRNRSRRTIIRALIALAIASFAVGGWQSWQGDVTAGFYLLPSRIWELMLGGLVALGAYPRISSRLLRDVLCWLALAGIVACCIMIGARWPFPVPFALPPAGCAAILLAYASGNRASALLSWRPLRGIGLISYSLYLWHRPVIAYYLTGRAFTPTPLDTAILIALSVAAGTLSYALIERPALRRWRKGSGLALHRAALAALGLLVAAGLAVVFFAPRIGALPPDVAKVIGYLGFEGTPAGKREFGTGRCFEIPTGNYLDPACLRIATDRPSVLLVGDSHAAQLSQALRERLEPGLRLQQVTVAGCRPALDTRGLRRCRRVRDIILRETDLSRVSAIVLAGRWEQEDIGPLAKTVASLRARKVPVVAVIGPVVEYDADMPDILARAMLAGDPERIAALRITEREAVDDRLGPAVRAAGGRYLSHFAIECPTRRCRLFMPDGAPTHIDHSHLSPLAARVVADRIVPLLRDKSGD